MGSIGSAISSGASAISGAAKSVAKPVSSAVSGGGGFLSDVGGALSTGFDIANQFLGSPTGQTVVGAGGAYLAGQASQDAADAQARAADRSTQAIMEMYQQTRRDLTPWRTTGSGALAQYGALSGVGAFGRPTTPEETAQAQQGFVETPGYQFRFDEGVRALDRSAASRGLLRSGGHERELTRYGQGIASEEFNTYANRLANLAGLGQDAGTSTGQFGTQAAAGAAESAQAAGTARASGYAGVANAYTAGVQNILAAYAKP